MLPLVVELEDTARGVRTVHAFERSPVRVGRNPLNDLVLDAAYASRWHGVLHFDADSVRYVDLGSTAGSALNGLRVPSQTNHPVSPVDRIEIGTIVLRTTRTAVSPALLAQSTRRQSAPSPEPHRGARTAYFDPTARATAPNDAQVDAAVARIAPYYAAYRRAFAEAFEQAGHYLQTLPEPDRNDLLTQLAEKCPALANEPDLRELARKLGLDVQSLDQRGGNEFMATGRAGRALEAFADAFVELRRGTEQFAHDMALKTPDVGAIGEAKTGPELLALLEDPKHGDARIHELVRGFAAIALHQIALMQGVMAGGRALLSRLAPESLNGTAIAASPPRLFSFWPFRAAGLLKRYAERHAGLVAEDHFSRELFGAAFARAYYTIAGGGEAPRRTERTDPSMRPAAPALRHVA